MTSLLNTKFGGKVHAKTQFVCNRLHDANQEMFCVLFISLYRAVAARVCILLFPTGLIISHLFLNISLLESSSCVSITFSFSFFLQITHFHFFFVFLVINSVTTDI